MNNNESIFRWIPKNPNKLQRAMLDLYFRFVFSLSPAETYENNPQQYFYHVQKAFWWYLDFSVKRENSKLPQIRKEDEFVRLFHESTPLARFNSAEFFQKHTNHKTNRLRVPRAGAVIVHETGTKILLIRSTKNNLTLPGGKSGSPTEPKLVTAVREVFEETGFDISDIIVPTLFVDVVPFKGASLSRFYVIPNVNDEETQDLSPLTRGEVKSIQWYKISSGHVKRLEAFKAAIKMFPTLFNQD
ncbi:hypothetical protein PCE1_003261 [Barthelona sp. PCE]